ncbi:MAG TPA: DUF3341 domain-containing protein [Falsiroseomonas sp.]|jgi:hypothetical protein|nr:DUF3341 domain-containing protein [Falsiroseomonas sp.]
MTQPAGMIAEFADVEEMLAALRAARAAGWRRLDAYAPYPVPEAAALLAVRGWPVAAVAVAAGLAGAVLQYGTQYYLNVVDYPINVGGRPLHAWPVFLPATYIVAVLWAAIAALVGMLVLNQLPRLHHPVFAAPGFDRASEDRFFLCLFVDEPGFDAARAEHLLRGFDALRISPVPAA